MDRERQKLGLENRAPVFKNRKILVMGLGLHGGGAGTIEFLARQKARISVTDLRSRRELLPELKKLAYIKGVRYILGRHRYADFSEADLIIKNPGVSVDSPYLRFAQKNHVSVTTDMGIFFSRCQGTIIGVTGTRGKSTTSFLIAEFLSQKKGKSRVFLAGNIRKSVFEILPHVAARDFVILELSSFQLEDLSRERKSPSVAVFTNILRDHLNRHKNFQDYKNAKAAIFKFQSRNDYLFISNRDQTVKTLVRHARSRIIASSLPQSFVSLVDARLGPHYRDSAGIALSVGKHFKVGEHTMRRVLKRFHSLPGREQYIGSYGGINFVNDTTATIPEAAIAALKRFGNICKKTRRRLILIAGGQDKKLIFGDLARAISNFADFCVMLPGTATEKIVPLLKKEKYAPTRLSFASSMSEAVIRACAFAHRGDWVILSPGAASFGLFLNEFDRGDQFNRYMEKFAAMPKNPR